MQQSAFSESKQASLPEIIHLQCEGSVPKALFVMQPGWELVKTLPILVLSLPSLAAAMCTAPYGDSTQPFLLAQSARTSTQRLLVRVKEACFSRKAHVHTGTSSAFTGLRFFLRSVPSARGQGTWTICDLSVTFIQLGAIPLPVISHAIL